MQTQNILRENIRLIKRLLESN